MQKLPKEFLLPSVGEGQDEGERIVKANDVNRSSTAKTRTLRRKFTAAEQKLWSYLRGRRISGEKFRRQHPLGRYVVDFVCLEKKLIVEVDGGQHAESAYDEERTSWLESEGFRVVRFWNNEVLGDIGIVLDAIYMELKSGDMYHPHPSPLPSRERVKEPEMKVRMETGAVGEGRPDACLLASVPSRGRGEILAVKEVIFDALCAEGSPPPSSSPCKGEERVGKGGESNQNAKTEFK